MKRTGKPIHGGHHIDFARINRAAVARALILLLAWLPGGRLHGREYIVRNPLRHDRSTGSFCINTRTGRWADFATGDRGSDLIALLAYLRGISQSEAARIVAAAVGIDVGGSRAV